MKASVKAAIRGVHGRLLPLQRSRGALFIGYAEANLGLGESFRCDVAAAARAGVSIGIYPFNVAVESRRVGPFMPEYYARAQAYDVNIIHVSVDQLPNVRRYVDHRLFSGSYNVLRTYWELPSAPEAWRPLLADIDEIWAPNDFVADAFRNIFARRITIIPPAVAVDEGAAPARAAFAMAPDRYYFLFSFDYLSSPCRKNPEAVLRAFRDAFPTGSEPVGLVVKSIGGSDRFAQSRGALADAAQADPRIVIIERSFERREMMSLIRSCDAYVSLHRAEGFGAGMAEAMLFGKTVIGTDFSGNRDFLTEETGFPVPYALRPVEPHEYIWSQNQSWAEPDVRAAAARMRYVVEHRDAAAKRALRGQALAAQKYGAEAVGSAIRRRIEEIQAELSVVGSVRLRPPSATTA